MESTLGTYPGVLARLAADEPAEARSLAAEAIAQWSQQGFHVQHLTHYFGNTYIDLYEGDGPAAWRRAESTWPLIQASLLDPDRARDRRRTSVTVPQRCGGCCHRRRILARFRRLPRILARKLLRNPSKWFHAAALLARAGVASQRRDAGAVGSFARAGRGRGRRPAGRALRRRGQATTRQDDRGGSRPSAHRPGRCLDVGTVHRKSRPHGSLLRPGISRCLTTGAERTGRGAGQADSDVMRSHSKSAIFTNLFLAFQRSRLLGS